MGYWIWSDFISQRSLSAFESRGYSTGIIEKAIFALEQKTIIWESYVSAILNNNQKFFLGYMGEQPLSSQFSSAHSYYLDFVYNFGFMGVLPIFVLIGYTAFKVYKSSEAIMGNPALFFPCITLAFLLVVENSFYMGLRQPYSAILTFFLWGIVLRRLLCLRNQEAL
jgi:O-antigen ligase